MTHSHLHSVEDNHISSNNNCSGDHIGLLVTCLHFHSSPFPKLLKASMCSLYLIVSFSMVNNCSYIFPSQEVHLSACCFFPTNVIQHIIDVQLFGASPNGEKHQYIFLKIHSNWIVHLKIHSSGQSDLYVLMSPGQFLDPSGWFSHNHTEDQNQV